MKLLLILGELLIFVGIFCEVLTYMCPYMQRDSYNKSMDTEFSKENEALTNVHNLVSPYLVPRKGMPQRISQLSKNND